MCEKLRTLKESYSNQHLHITQLYRMMHSHKIATRFFQQGKSLKVTNELISVMDLNTAIFKTCWVVNQLADVPTHLCTNQTQENSNTLITDQTFVVSMSCASNMYCWHSCIGVTYNIIVIRSDNKCVTRPVSKVTFTFDKIFGELACWRVNLLPHFQQNIKGDWQEIKTESSQNMWEEFPVDKRRIRSNKVMHIKYS